MWFNLYWILENRKWSIVTKKQISVYLGVRGGVVRTGWRGYQRTQGIFWGNGNICLSWLWQWFRGCIYTKLTKLYNFNMCNLLHVKYNWIKKKKTSSGALFPSIIFATWLLYSCKWKNEAIVIQSVNYNIVAYIQFKFQCLNLMFSGNYSKSEEIRRRCWSRESSTFGIEI